MPAGTADDDFFAARSQGFGRDVIDAGAVEDDHRAQLRAIRVDERAHSAKIAFALFTDVCGEQNGAKRFYFRRLHGAGNGEQAGKARAVVGNARRQQAIPFAPDFDFGTGGENRVEMRREKHDIFVFRASQFADYVADLVGEDGKAVGGKDFFYRLRALCFFERGSGNLRQADLLRRGPIEIVIQPVQSLAHLRSIREGLRTRKP